MSVRVYIETSVPSAHVSTRSDAASINRRDITRQWWDRQLPNLDAFVSENVMIELRRGQWPGQNQAIELVSPIPMLAATEEVSAVAARYIREKLLPSDVVGDAAHLAFASVYEVDYLATWNIRHLANLNKQRHLATINRRLGLFTPRILTPELIWMEEES